MSVSQTINQFLHRRGPHDEVEIRLGKQRINHFCSGVHFRHFAKCLEHMQETYPHGKKTNTVDYQKGRTRLTVRSGKETCIEKRRVEVNTFQGMCGPFDIRVALSTETPRALGYEEKVELTTCPDMIREKDRITYDFDGFQIDMTVAIVHVDNKFKASDLDKEEADVTYEIEIEIRDSAKTREAFQWVYTLSNIIERSAEPNFIELA